MSILRRGVPIEVIVPRARGRLLIARARFKGGKCIGKQYYNEETVWDDPLEINIKAQQGGQMLFRYRSVDIPNTAQTILPLSEGMVVDMRSCLPELI